MTFGNALVSFFKNIFNFSGRARRKEYFSVMLLIVIINIALSFLLSAILYLLLCERYSRQFADRHRIRMERESL